jgi:hypothetical protein
MKVIRVSHGMTMNNDAMLTMSISGPSTFDFSSRQFTIIYYISAEMMIKWRSYRYPPILKYPAFLFECVLVW